MKNKLTADNYTSVVTFGHVVKLLRSDSSMALQEGAHFFLLSLTMLMGDLIAGYVNYRTSAIITCS